MLSSGTTKVMRVIVLALASLAMIGLCLVVLTGCAYRRARWAPSVSTAREIARQQHTAFTAQQRVLDAQAVPIESARSHSAEAGLRARQIDAKARVILEHW